MRSTTDPAASALVTAYTWAGNAGAGVVPARALVNLSDFLHAPSSIPRGPFQEQMIRIGKHRDGSKVGVFIYCQQHAREWTTPLVCLETAERLLRNYAHRPDDRVSRGQPRYLPAADLEPGRCALLVLRLPACSAGT